VNLTSADLRMALAAVSYYRRAHILSRRPVPPAADALVEHLEQALMSASGQESVAPQAEWLSTGQVARRLGCSERTARRMAPLIGRRAGRDWVISADALPQRQEDSDVA
jgi:AraC-like DNA-binding protein